MAQEKKQNDVRAAPTSIGGGGGFKLNVHAQEFVPRSVVAAHTQIPTVPAGYCYPYFFPSIAGGSISGGSGSEWFYIGDQQERIVFMPDPCVKIPGHSKNNVEVVQKIVKQVEYQFSDTNLVASDFLMKIMNKDPEGYVPMSVIASWKKIKALGANNQMLIKALRTSTKLSVSDDGKKVRRKQLFTERDREDLQLRTVIVENLPEDYSRQSLEKMFSAVGSVKNIRICHPQEANVSRPSKGDVLVSNKVHALVEYETADQADKAVEKLNDERNWRKGLRVRSMLRRSPRSVIRNKRSGYNQFDTTSEDEQSPLSQASGCSHHVEQLLEQITEECQGGRKTWGRGRVKPIGSLQITSNRGVHCQSQLAGCIGQCETPKTPQGPRMPDGTRGFTMGRGRSPNPVFEYPQLTPIGLRPIQL